MINTLLIEDPSCSSQLGELEIVPALNNVLDQHMDDEDLVEKTLVTLRSFLQSTSSPVPAATLELIRPNITEAKSKYAKYILDSEAWADLENGPLKLVFA